MKAHWMKLNTPMKAVSLLCVVVGLYSLVQYPGSDGDEIPDRVFDFSSTYESSRKNSKLIDLIDQSQGWGKHNDHETALAKQNVDRYLSMAAKSVEPPAKHTIDNIRSYLTELNQLAKDYFVYKNGAMITSYANQYADCDLYSLLIKEAAYEQGIELHFITLPGHAFISWLSPDGESINWETTTNAEANLSEPLYTVGKDEWDYTPLSYDIIRHMEHYEVIASRYQHFKHDEIAAIVKQQKPGSLSTRMQLKWVVLAKEEHLPLHSKYKSLFHKAIKESPSEFWLKEQVIESYSYDESALKEIWAGVNVKDISTSQYEFYLDNNPHATLKENVIFWIRDLL